MYDPVKEAQLEKLQEDVKKHLAECDAIKTLAKSRAVILGGVGHAICSVAYYFLGNDARKAQYYEDHKWEVDDHMQMIVNGDIRFLNKREPNYNWNDLTYANLREKISHFYATHPDKRGDYDWMIRADTKIFNMYIDDRYDHLSLLESIFTMIPSGFVSAGLVGVRYAIPYIITKRASHKNDAVIRKLEDELFWDR